MTARLARLLLVLITVGAFALLPTPSLATPISGTLNIGGSDAVVAATFLNFLCTATSQGAQPCPAGYGNFTTTATSTGSFQPYIGDSGFIHSLTSAGQPVNVPFSLANFIYFSPTGIVANPDIALDLTFLYTGNFGQAQCSTNPALAAPGQTCTPVIPQLVSAANPNGLSPFNLSNTATGSSASFSVSGIARRISTGELSPFNGLFTAQFSSTPGTNDGSFQALLASLSQNGTFQSSYSANFTAVITPEPGTTMMLMGGLFLIGGLASKKRFQQRDAAAK